MSRKGGKSFAPAQRASSPPPPATTRREAESTSASLRGAFGLLSVEDDDDETKVASPAPVPGSPSPPSASSSTNSEYEIKHPLQHTWTLWHDTGGKGSSWEPPKQIGSFGTVEDFWSIFKNVPVPSNLSEKSSYHMFKEGIVPEWEDKANVGGGKWQIMLMRESRDPGAAKASQLDAHWLTTLLTLIGEGFAENGEAICGCVMNLRPGADRIAIWTRKASDSVTMSIGEGFKASIGSGRFEFSLHGNESKQPKFSIK